MLIWEVTCGEHCIQKAHSMIMLLDSMLLALLKHSTIFTSVNMFTGKPISSPCTLSCMHTVVKDMCSPTKLVTWNQKISWSITTVTFVWSIWDSLKRFWLDIRHGHSVVLLNTFAQVILPIPSAQILYFFSRNYFQYWSHNRCRLLVTWYSYLWITFKENSIPCKGWLGNLRRNPPWYRKVISMS